MLNIIDVLGLKYDDFRKLVKESKYNGLIQRKMKIIISTALLGHVEAKKVYLIERIGDENVDDEIERFVSGLSMRWCEMNHKGVFTQFSLDEARQKLSDIEPGEIVLLREFVITDYCGYVSWNADRNVFIEVRRGGFYSFWEARGIPSYYIMDKNKNVLVAEEHTTDYFASYDYDNRCWNKVEKGDEVVVSLADGELSQIADILINVSKNYRNAKIAWIKSGDEIVVFDIWLMFNQGVLE